MNKKALVGILIGVVALTSLAVAPVYGGNGKGKQTAGDVIPGSFIVVLNEAASPQGVAEDHGVIRTQTYQHALKGFAGKIPASKLDDLRNDSRVQWVEPDRVVSILDPPPHNHDTDDGDAQPAQVTPTGVNRTDADLSATANIDGVDERVDVDIAIIDTGIDTKHPDLNVFNHVRCSGTGSNRDQNGHGTHVAGTAAALDNEEGGVGVAPGARLWGVKVLNASGSGTLGCVIVGVDYVTSHANEIEVANMSLGCECTSAALDTAITNSVAAGVVYAVAAGNSSKDAATFSPANHPDVITVSAIADFDGQGGALASTTCRDDVGTDDTFATFSNYGSLVEIAAPGVCILSTWLDDGYYTISGTSMAAPHAAGVAALYMANNSEASPTDVLAALIANGMSQTGDDGFDLDPDGPDGHLEPLLNATGF